MNNYNKKWLLLIVLSIIWGSSFILIKKGLAELSPIHIGSLRIIFTTFVIITFSYKSLMKIKKETIEQVSKLTNLVKILDNRVKKLEDDNSFDLQDLKKECNVKGYTNE